MSFLVMPLLVMALLVMTLLAGTATAATITLSGASGKAEVQGQVSLDVDLDTGSGLSGITLLSIGVLYSTDQLAYRQDLSSTSSYILYNGKGSAYMYAASTCGGGYGGPTSRRSRIRSTLTSSARISPAARITRAKPTWLPWSLT